MLLSTDIWVGALIRRAEIGGAFPMVLRKGDVRAGAVLVKVLNRSEGTARLFAEAVMPKVKDLFGEWEDRWWPKPMAREQRAPVPAFAPARAAE